MDVDTFLSENKERYEIIQSLQEQLNHITQDSYEDVIKFIKLHESHFLNSHENAVLFLSNINIFTIINFTKAEILLDIVIHFEKEIKSQVEELEILDIITSVLCFTYYLYDKGFYSIETILNKSVTKFEFFAYFYPEIDEYDHEMAEKITNIINEYDSNSNLTTFLDFVIKNKEKHIENRKHYYNPLSLHKAIREDNIEEFQSIVAKNNYDYNYNFEFSYYERTFTENPTPSMIQIAAIYGSVHIFKYLWMQKNIFFDDDLISYAISGRNYDIIHICEEKCSRKRALIFSINSHQHELTDYFIDSIKDDEIEKEDLKGYQNDDDNMYDIISINFLKVAYSSNNYHVLLPCLKKIVYFLDNVENNITDTNYFCFLGNLNFDFNLFKFIYSHKNKNVDLFNGNCPIYYLWIFNGMSDEIMHVLPTLTNLDSLIVLRNSLYTNIRVAKAIFEFIIRAKNPKEYEHYHVFSFETLLKYCQCFNKYIIEQLLRFGVEIENPELFVDHLLEHSSRKFINSLFKMKLNLGNSKEEIAIALRKNGLCEAADNL